MERRTALEDAHLAHGQYEVYRLSPVGKGTESP